MVDKPPGSGLRVAQDGEREGEIRGGYVSVVEFLAMAGVFELAEGRGRFCTILAEEVDERGYYNLPRADDFGGEVA